jgi:hypothetical protein
MSKDERLDEIELTDDQIREVIERATRISTDLDRISFKELRAIANELGIDSVSLERALSEVMVADVPRSRPEGAESKTGFWTRGPRALLSGSAGWVVGLIHAQLGWVATTAVGGATVELGSSGRVDGMVTMALAAASLTSLISNRKGARLNRYLVEVSTIWSGYYVAWVILRGTPSAPINLFASAGLAISMAVGAIALRATIAKYSGGTPSSGNQESSSAGTSLVEAHEEASRNDDENVTLFGKAPGVALACRFRPVPSSA